MAVSVSAHVIIKRSDEVLLIRRADTGFWATPGGRVEYNETFEQAAIREIQEECGITVKIDGICGVFSNPNWDEGIHTIVFVSRFDRKIETQKTTEAKEISFYNINRLPMETLHWHREYVKSAYSGVLIKNHVFTPKSPEQILKRRIDYTEISEVERVSLLGLYIRQ
jgi:8-oxo-dGTP diphosphatase